MLVVCIMSTLATSVTRSEASTGISAIDWLEKEGILSDIFMINEIKKNPNQVITRQEYIILLMIAADEKESQTAFAAMKYSDKSGVKKQFKQYIAAADRLGLLRPVVKNKKSYIYPNSKLTRQMAVYYLAKLSNMNMEQELESYSDFDKIEKDIQPYVEGLYFAGALDHIKNKFEPRKAMTWKDAATLIKNVWDVNGLQNINVNIVAGKIEENQKPTGMELNAPTGLTRGQVDDVIYVADTNNNVIKSIENGKISVLAGQVTEKNAWNESMSGYKDGNIKTAMFNQPTGIRAVKDGLLVVDTGNHCLRLVNTKAGIVTTYAGNGKAGNKTGERKAAQFDTPRGIDISPNGDIYVSDTRNHCIRKIDKNGIVTTFAGIAGTDGYMDGSIQEATFNQPTGIVYDGGVLYVADTGNQRIRKIENGVVTTLAGSSVWKISGTKDYVGGYQDGDALSAQFDTPINITIDAKGVLYVADKMNHMIRTIKDGQVKTLAGFGGLKTDEGTDWSNYLMSPDGMFVSTGDGKLYVADTFYNRVSSFDLE